MPSDNHGAQHDTSRLCCDGRCFQRNPSQGGSCPLDRHEPAANDEKADLAAKLVDLAYWIAGLGLLGALVRGCLEASQ